MANWQGGSRLPFGSQTLGVADCHDKKDEVGPKQEREFLKKLLPSRSAKSSGPLLTGLEKLIVLYDVMHGVRVNC
jgi:hypothetical protein